MTELHDILLTGPTGGHDLTDTQLHSLLRWLAARGWVIPTAEAVARDWTEVYCKPGASAHEIFIEGEAPDAPAFAEFIVRTGPKKPLPYGVGDVQCYVEFRGCMYASVPGKFREKLGELLLFRPRQERRIHTELPPHLEVPEEEKKVKKKASPSTSTAPVGTRVEEF